MKKIWVERLSKEELNKLSEEREKEQQTNNFCRSVKNALLIVFAVSLCALIIIHAFDYFI